MDTDKIKNFFINHIEKMFTLAGFDDPDAARKQYVENEGAMRQLQMMVLEDQVVEHVIGKARVTEQLVAFKDIMNFGAAEASED